jgi:hypothetical protein
MHDAAMRRAALLLVALVAAPACGAKSGTAPQCQKDPQCGDDFGCVGGTCIPRANPPGDWGVELVPRSDSMAALTEFSGVNFGAGQLQLAADPKVTVMATFPSDGSTPSAAHVIVTVPAIIAGRPDLQFETDLGTVQVDTGASLPQFSVPVPKGVLGRMGTVQLNPTAPADQDHAPFTFHLPLAPALQLAVPPPSYIVTGRLFDAIGSPRIGFLARAFRAGQLVSSV